jgi:D-arabinose 1-dehydrogenase-like Zn-dependent alcohol dehydrogenase
MVAPVEALAQMPESLDPSEAALLMCAGVTTLNSLRHSGALPSDLVAIQGIGGLGHMGIQFALLTFLWAGYHRWRASS